MEISPAVCTTVASTAVQPAPKPPIATIATLAAGTTSAAYPTRAATSSGNATRTSTASAVSISPSDVAAIPTISNTTAFTSAVGAT